MLKPRCKDGRVSRADLSKDPSAVAAMFDGVAQRYDLANDVLALGQTRVWRRAVVLAVKPQPGEMILDLAAGTGTSSVPFAKAGSHVIPTDFSLGMLRVGHERQPELPFVAGDGLNLPFRDNSFDAATISFGLRNLTDRAVGLAEFRRVLKPGGRLVICEFSSPTLKPLRTIYTEYLMKALPAVATKVATNPDAYVYLAESIRAWPDQAELADEITAAGFTEVQWRNLTGGIVAVHRAVNP